MTDEPQIPPLKLDEDQYSHVHGRLELHFGDRVLPHLGFWGPDDVCFGHWLIDLRVVLNRLSDVETGEWAYDEGEQGQPAFVFRRDGDTLAVSIEDSTLSDGRADEDWGVAHCSWADFCDAVEQFLMRFRSHLLAEAGDAGRGWWASVDGSAADAQDF